MEKYEYFTVEDLGHRQACLKKLNLSILHWVYHLVNHLNKMMLKIAKNESESDFNYDGKYNFYEFYKGYDDFEEMSLDSKYNKMKKFTNLLNIFQNHKPKNPKTQLKKERIMKNVDELYEKYYNAHKNDYDKDDGLDEGKKKKFD